MQERLEALLKPPQLYGVAALVLTGIASFFFAVAYFDGTAHPATSQIAATQVSTDVFSGISLHAQAAIVYDIRTGKTLFERNADTQLPLASITKVMLALVVAENLARDTKITIPYETAPVGSSQRLGAGEKWTVGDITTFVLVSSSNEGADILADAAGKAVQKRFAGAPTEAPAIWRMNTLARDIGMTRSYFLNANGLDVTETQSGAYGSARDVARLLAYAASSSPEVFSVTAENGILLATERGDHTQALNTNEALGDIAGLIMGKTGYTDLAGGNLAVVYDVGLAHPLVAVILGSTREGRFEDMRKLVPASREAIRQ